MSIPTETAMIHVQSPIGFYSNLAINIFNTGEFGLLSYNYKMIGFGLFSA
jgi:hypothetical protein